MQSDQHINKGFATAPDNYMPIQQPVAGHIREQIKNISPTTYPNNISQKCLIVYMLIGGIIFAITSVIPVSSISRTLQLGPMRLLGSAAAAYTNVIVRTILFMIVFFLAVKNVPTF